MTRIQEKVYEMLCRVRQFLDDYAAALGKINQSSARKELDTLVSSMAYSATAATTSGVKARGETARTRALKRALRMKHMQQIAAIARAELPHVPQFEPLRLPPSKEGRATLVLRARAMAAVAREHAAVFLAHQLPADFADQLEAAAGALEASVQQRGLDVQEGVGARSGLAASRSRAHYVVRVLSTQVETALEGDAKLLGQWKFAKRVGLSTSGASSTTVAPPATMTIQPQPALAV